MEADVKYRKGHLTHAKRGRYWCQTCNAWLHERRTVQEHRDARHIVLGQKELPSFLRRK